MGCRVWAIVHACRGSVGASGTGPVGCQGSLMPVEHAVRLPTPPPCASNVAWCPGARPRCPSVMWPSLSRDPPCPVALPWPHPTTALVSSPISVRSSGRRMLLPSFDLARRREKAGPICPDRLGCSSTRPTTRTGLPASVSQLWWSANLDRTGAHPAPDAHRQRRSSSVHVAGTGQVKPVPQIPKSQEHDREPGPAVQPQPLQDRTGQQQQQSCPIHPTNRATLGSNTTPANPLAHLPRIPRLPTPTLTDALAGR